MFLKGLGLVSDGAEVPKRPKGSGCNPLIREFESPPLLITMAKILIRPKRVADGRTVQEEKFFYVADPSKEYHCCDGKVEAADLKKPKLTTNKGIELFCIDTSFIDEYKHMKRSPQMVPLKDIGPIIAYTGIIKDSKVLDAGAGSGGICTLLAKIAKKVYSYEIRDDFHALVKNNIRELGLKNITLKKQDVYQGIKEKDLDVIIFDLPEPWKAIPHANKALKTGGFLVIYSPSIPQIMDAMTAIAKEPGLIPQRTIEVIERDWEITDRKVRPRSAQIAHSGFLIFARKIAGD